jgi:hypothetical protein
MAETPRQEIELELGGKTYTVRPDFRTISAIEAATEQAARALGLKCLAASMPVDSRRGTPEVSMTELAQAIFWMLKDKKNAPATPMDVGDLLMEEGYGKLLMPVGEFLIRAQRGNKEHQKEAAQAAAQANPPSQGDSPKT